MTKNNAPARKGRPFRHALRVQGLPTGKIAYFHATKGLRNRRPTMQLMTAILSSRFTATAEVAQ